jgi:anti-sigma B factor antagonist
VEAAMTAMKPKITVEYSENATIVTLADEKILEEEDIRALSGSMMSLIEQSQPLNLVVDFCNVQFLSSAVLGLLIRVSKKIYESNGWLGLCNINSKIHEIFKITRLTKIFDIYPDLDSALRALSETE